MTWGGHPNSSRQHLDALAEAGLLEVVTIMHRDTGRPPRGYSLTRRGRATLGGTGEDASRELLAAASSFFGETEEGPEQARRMGEKWGASRARAAAASGHSEPEEVVTDVFTALGFDPGRPGKGRVLLRACPLADLARANPTFICTAHEGMARGMMRGLGVDGEVRLEPFADPSGCVLHLPRAAEPGDAGRSPGASLPDEARINDERIAASTPPDPAPGS
ncbi:hypothetical protein M3G03_00175 [Aestuariimicrobium sp. p3-SID1156]|uniref:helix-turn-helix transcriptional regulator n=1 Tax=Aestuariimicrobium sp. p3-SID1156 TaxID=2916038 RepID=UPI00223ABF98|nr:hypothetical protein [Aestuariimicrobium sp. p3-SID1156]MCT1457974.1 hypothetical protein [Aestuariimicrobium sp. p3-SID1156]